MPESHPSPAAERWRHNLLAKAGLAVGILAIAAGGATDKSTSAEADNTKGGRENNAPFLAAVMEDAGNTADPKVAAQIMQEAKQDGFNAVIETDFWGPGLTQPRPDKLRALQVSTDAAIAAGLEPIIRLFPDWHPAFNLHMPIGVSDQKQFAHYAFNLALDLPKVKYISIGNEPNSQKFWYPQYNQDGTPAAPAAYEHLLSTTYPVLKQAGNLRGNPVTVIGEELASGGNNDPHSAKKGLAPRNFLLAERAAYLASSYSGPVMDIEGVHTYTENNNDSPDTVYNDGTYSLGKVAQIRQDLEDAFSGTGQPTDIPIMATEYGVNMNVSRYKTDNYQGSENATAVPPEVAGAFYTKALKLAYCQNLAGMALFLLRDERNLKGWQSGQDTPSGAHKNLPFVQNSLSQAATGSLNCN